MEAEEEEAALNHEYLRRRLVRLQGVLQHNIGLFCLYRDLF
jgi:hypothetical protein